MMSADSLQAALQLNVHLDPTWNSCWENLSCTQAFRTRTLKTSSVTNVLQNSQTHVHVLDVRFQSSSPTWLKSLTTHQLHSSDNSA
ncbi:hypothetical protein GN956_G6794 [Arapaima gigas]